MYRCSDTRGEEEERNDVRRPACLRRQIMGPVTRQESINTSRLLISQVGAQMGASAGVVSTVPRQATVRTRVQCEQRYLENYYNHQMTAMRASRRWATRRTMMADGVPRSGEAYREDSGGWKR